MTRDVLLSILREAEGLSEKGKVWRTSADHRVTFYLGNDGRGMVVQDVSAIEPHDTYLLLSAIEPGRVYLSYDQLFAIAIKPPSKKAGFA